MNDKRYYWLKLEENYFDLKVQKALRKLPSGSDMLICYLKMQLKYLNKGGLIEYQGIYDELAEEIALDIDEELDLVKMTLGVLEKWRVLEPSEDGIFITEMQERIGSKSDSAIRVAKHREKQKLLQCNIDVTKCNSIKEKEIEKDIEIDIEKEKDKEKESTLYDFIQEKFLRELTPLEYEKISLLDDNELTRYAILQATTNGKHSINYINGILNNWKMQGITTIEEAKGKPKKDLPQWLNQEIEENTATPEEIAELERLMK